MEFNILENIDRYETRVKDKVSMYYKKIENYILDEEDEFYMKIEDQLKHRSMGTLQKEQNETDSELPSDEE